VSPRHSVPHNEKLQLCFAPFTAVRSSCVRSNMRRQLVRERSKMDRFWQRRRQWRRRRELWFWSKLSTRCIGNAVHLLPRRQQSGSWKCRDGNGPITEGTHDVLQFEDDLSMIQKARCLLR